MLTRLRFVLLLVLPMLLPMTALSAQQSAPRPAAAGPRLELTAAAMQQPATEQSALVQARTNSQGKPIALMVVGGAALVLGIVVGSDIGTLLSIGGAIAFLYGLYLYLR